MRNVIIVVLALLISSGSPVSAQAGSPGSIESFMPDFLNYEHPQLSKFACTCPIANPAMSECDWPQGKCAARNCFEKKPAGGADCSSSFSGAYCGCEITCQLIHANGTSEPAHPVFTGSLITPEIDCTGSSEDMGNGDKIVCVAVKLKKKAATDADSSGFKTYGCQ